MEPIMLAFDGDLSRGMPGDIAPSGAEPKTNVEFYVDESKHSTIIGA
jgi:hypothetical protein